jgi:serine phosphatase RsbU (regulator of sigma subunit)
MIAPDVSRLCRPHDGVADSHSDTDLDIHVTVWNSPAGGARAGGDWCDAFALSDSAVAFTIGDVCGHGEEVADTMAVVRSAVVGAMYDLRAPSDALGVANNSAFRCGDGVIVTAIVAILDHRLRTLTFANAGHPPPLMLTRAGHAFLAHSPADLPLGIFPQHSAGDYVLTVPHDALLILYTDGITEHRRDPIGGEQELVEAARAIYARPPRDLAGAIARHVLQRRRGSDDAAAIGLRTSPLLAR